MFLFFVFFCSSFFVFFAHSFGFCALSWPRLWLLFLPFFFFLLYLAPLNWRHRLVFKCTLLYVQADKQAEKDIPWRGHLLPSPPPFKHQHLTSSSISSWKHNSPMYHPAIFPFPLSPLNLTLLRFNLSTTQLLWLKHS